MKLIKKIGIILITVLMSVNFSVARAQTSPASLVQTNQMQNSLNNIGQNFGQQMQQMMQGFAQGIANSGIGTLQNLLSNATQGMPPALQQLLNSVIQPVFQQLQNAINQGFSNVFSSAQQNYLSSLGIINPNDITEISLDEAMELASINPDMDILDQAIGDSIDNYSSMMDNIAESVQNDIENWQQYTEDNLAEIDQYFSGSADEMQDQIDQMQGDLDDLENPVDNTNIIDMANEAYQEAQAMQQAAGSVVPQYTAYVTNTVLVKEVGDQLQKIKEMLGEIHKIRLASELSRDYLKKLSELETDEDTWRKEQAKSAEEVRNDLSQMIQKEVKDILEKVVTPNMIKNLSDDLAAKFVNENEPQFIKEMQEALDELLEPVEDDSQKEIYQDVLSDPDGRLIAKRLAVEKCPTADEVNNATGKEFFNKWHQFMDSKCRTWETSLTADEMRTMIYSIAPASVTSMDLMLPSDFMSETEIKENKPEKIRSKDEIVDSVNTITNSNIKEQIGNRESLAPVVDPENMESNITQKLAEEAQNWLDQIIEQGLSALQDLLSGLLDQQGDNNTDNNNDNTNVTPSDQTSVYNLAEAQNDLANAESLLKSQKLLNENLTGKYLPEQQSTLNSYNQIQEGQRQILYFLKSLYLGSTSTSTPNKIGVSCALPSWVTVSVLNSITTITAGSFGDISFTTNGNVTSIHYQITSTVDVQNQNIKITQERITALGLAISSTENLISLLNKLFQPKTMSGTTMPTIDEILNAKQTAILLGAKAVSSSATDSLIQLDGDTQKFNLDVVNLASQFVGQRQALVEILANLSLNLTSLQNQYQSCLLK